MKFSGTLTLETKFSELTEKAYDYLIFTFDDGQTIIIDDEIAERDFLKHAYVLQDLRIKALETEV